MIPAGRASSSLGCGDRSLRSSVPTIQVRSITPPTYKTILSRILGLLIFRLFRYRREFHRLISARNTTKSRFIRLFLMAKIFITVFLPYNICILYVQASTAKDPYDWNFVHGSNWNTIIKVPTHGEIRWDRWAQIASGYLLFLLFGTGLDAHNTYKRMFCAVGLGKIFPSLHVMRESSSATPSSVTFAKGFASSCASKAKSYFSKGDSSIDSLPGSTRSDSIYLDTPTKGRPVPFQHIPTNEPMLPPRSTHFANMSSTTRSVFNRMFGGGSHQSLVLPLFASKSVDQMSAVEKSPVESIPSGVHARAWAVDGSAAMRHGNGGVHVVHEVHQAHYNGNAAKKGTQVTDWA
jgi:pheromone a factor receptor